MTVATRRDVVLVTGPWLAGTSSVAAALRAGLGATAVVEQAELAVGEAPAVVVFVVSAAAPMTESDCALLDAAAAGTDAVIAVVSRIDVHRTWREVLERDRATLAAHHGRYARTPWVGAAAAPDFGKPVLDGLVDAVCAELDDPTLSQRNLLRALDTRLADLRARRAALLRRRRLDKSARAIAVRSQVQQARVQLSYFARSRCAAVRCELQEAAATVTRRTRADFGRHVGGRVVEVVHEVDDGVAAHLSGVAADLGLAAAPVAAPPSPVDVPAPPVRPRRLETRLTTLLGTGFGLGVAVTLSRLFAGLATGWTLLAATASALAGIAVTLWVVGTRALLADRAVLDRWVGEVTAGLRATLEQRVATVVLGAESAFGMALAESDSAEGARLDGEIAGLDRQIRDIARAVAHAGTGARADEVLPNRSCE